MRNSFFSHFFVFLFPIAALTLFFPGHAEGDTTANVTFQGRLTQPGGQPVPDDTYAMQFTLFDAAADGTNLWTETDSLVSVERGLFSVQLGSATPFPQSLFADEPDLYLEVAADVNGNGLDALDVQTPRTPLAATPVSLHAKNAAMLGGLPAADFAKDADLDSSQSAQDAQIAMKADAITVDTALATKADAAEVDTALATKADASAVLKWQVVTSGPVQAERNRGYIVDGASSVTITLPDEGTLTVGDIVRVNCIGAGGWRLEQNPSQQVLTRSLQIPSTELDWTPRDSNRAWLGLCSSADGVKLAAVTDGGPIYTSTDSGLTWTPREAELTRYGLASSADGSKLVTAEYGGHIYTSVDSGVTWTPREGNRNWVSVASSVDGVNLVAAVLGGQIYTSTNSGQSWSPRDSTRQWNSVASSADGARLVAVVFGGQIYTSTNFGVGWTPRDSTRNWGYVASSYDGTRLVANVIGDRIYSSSDAGLVWRERDSAQQWSGIASSADGARCVAVTNGQQIHRSTDYGVTWTPMENSRSWSAVASSADGLKLVASVNGGQLFTYSAIVEQTTAGVVGAITGSQNTALELQYVGSGIFTPISHEGNLGAL